MEIQDIFLNDQFIEDYANLKDALNFEPSHHSAGFPESTNIFKDIYPMIRKDPNGDLLGWSMIEIPKNDDVREKIRNKLSNIRRWRYE